MLAAFFGLLGLVSFLFPPKQSLGAFLASVLVLAALLFGICWLKGEPPRWRWGK